MNGVILYLPAVARAMRTTIDLSTRLESFGVSIKSQGMARARNLTRMGMHPDAAARRVLAWASDAVHGNSPEAA